MTSSSYQDWTHEVINTHLRLSSTVPTRTVDKYTRAGRYGKTIVCGHCKIGGFSIGIVANQKNIIRLAIEAKNSEIKALWEGVSLRQYKLPIE